MTSIIETVNMITSESPADNSCTALISIAERAAEYEQVLRRSQMSKTCYCCHDIKTHEVRRTVPVKTTGTYIIC